MPLPPNWPKTGRLQLPDGTFREVELTDDLEDRLTKGELENLRIVIDGQEIRPWRFCSTEPVIWTDADGKVHVIL